MNWWDWFVDWNTSLAKAGPTTTTEQYLTQVRDNMRAQGRTEPNAEDYARIAAAFPGAMVEGLVDTLKLGVTGAHKMMTGEIPTTDPRTGHVSDQAIGVAQAMTSVAGTGGLSIGARGPALGAGPIRPKMPVRPKFSDLVANDRLPKHWEETYLDEVEPEVIDHLKPEAEAIAKRDGISLDDAYYKLHDAGRYDEVFDDIMEKSGHMDDLLSQLDEVDDTGGVAAQNVRQRNAIAQMWEEATTTAKTNGTTPQVELQRLLQSGRFGEIQQELLSPKKPTDLNANKGPAVTALSSAIDKAIEASPLSVASGSQWLGWLKKQPGVKGEEIDWRGLTDALGSKDKLSKSQVQDILAHNKVQIKEVVRRTTDPMDGGQHATLDEANEDLIQENVDDFIAEHGRPPTQAEMQEIAQGYRDATVEDEGGHYAYRGATKYWDQQLPGGENYREILLTTPPKGPQFSVDVKPGNNGSWIVYVNGQRNGAIAAPVRNGPEAFGRLPGDPPPEPLSREQALQIARQSTQENAVKYWGASPDNYQSPHWDEPNVLVHARVNDRYIPDPTVDPAAAADGTAAKPDMHTLFAEEIQSDWHQKGRKQGYKASDQLTPELTSQVDQIMDKVRGQYPQWGGQTRNDGSGYSIAALAPGLRDRGFIDEADLAIINRYEDARRADIANDQVPPDAPFKKTWPDLMLKRLMQEAADKNYDALAWTDGATQTERYDLSKQVNRIDAVKNSDGTYNLNVWDKSNQLVKAFDSDSIAADKLAEVVGKDLADKIIKGEGVPNKSGVGRTYAGLDLKVGGEGMKGFYDDILPRTAKRLWGVKVEDVQMPAYGEAKDVVDAIDYLDQFADRERVTQYDRDQLENMRNADILALAKSNGWTPTTMPVAHVIRITPELRARIAKGQSLFAAGVPAVAPSAGAASSVPDVPDDMQDRY